MTLRLLVPVAVAACLVSGCGTDQSAQTLKAARRHAQQIVASANTQASGELASAKKQAATIVAKAHHQFNRIVGSIASDARRAKSKLSDAQSKLSTINRELITANGKLTSLQTQISGAKATVAKDTFPGTGTFLINTQVNPGTYQAAPSAGCYWARLASANTSDIIDNNNSDGQITVQIAPSDVAFEANNCSTFRRVGP